MKNDFEKYRLVFLATFGQAIRYELESLLSHSKSETIKEYLSSEEGKVYQDYLKLQEMARKDVVKEIRKIVGEYLTQWLRDFANRPLKERENPFNEVAKIRKALSDILTKLK